MGSRAILTTLQREGQHLMVSSQGPPDPCRCVLVVDDDAAIRALLTTFLEQYGFAVRTAPDGTSALTLLQAEPFEAILVDLQMPGLSGLDMAAEVRRTNPHIPMALMTGTPEAVQPASLWQAGISRVFAKPFNLNDLFAWLKSLSL